MEYIRLYQSFRPDGELNHAAADLLYAARDFTDTDARRMQCAYASLVVVRELDASV